MKQKVITIFAAVCAVTGLFAAVHDENVFDVEKGEEWRLDFSWRIEEAPPTAFVHPFIEARDANGRIIHSASVGQIQQRTFGPEDMNIERWRVYAGVGGEVDRSQNYATSMDRIELPAATKSVRAVILGEGDPVRLGETKIEPVKLETPEPKQIDGFPAIPEDASKVLSDADLDAFLAKTSKQVPKLRSRGDRTELEVNGEVIVPRIYKTAAFDVPNRLPSVSQNRENGFNIFTIGIRFTDIWKSDGSVDTAFVRAEIRKYLKRNPEGLFMLVFIIQPHVGWAEKHPSEIYRNDKGRFGIVKGVYRVTEYRDRLEYDWKNDEYPAFSHTSEVFAKDAAEVLGRIFAELERWPEGKRVIGTYLNGGTDTQWLDAYDNEIEGVQFADWADCSKQRFAEFTTRKYGRAKAFNPADFREFYARCTAQMRLYMARAVKRASADRILVGGYSPNGGMAGWPLISQTYARRMMESPYWDFFAVVPDYIREHADVILSAVYDGSLARRGKLFISELDLRSWDVGNWGYWGSEWWRTHHNDETFRRKTLYFAANAVTHGGGYHAYDMDGGMYATEAARATWKAANAMAAKARTEEPVAESIALVAGERYWDHHPADRDRFIPYMLRELPKEALARTGVHWKTYLVDELLDAEEAKLPRIVIFSELTTVTAEQFAELKRRYARDGRVLVWMYRPGLFTADGAKLEKELGLRPAPFGQKKLPYADGRSPDPLMKGVKGMVMALRPYYAFDFPRLAQPDPAAKWQPLAFFQNTGVPALAVRRQKDFTELYASMPGGITAQLCRNLLREAKMDPLLETDEISGYGSGILYFVAQSDGRKIFRLPEGRVPGEVLAGPKFRTGADGRFSVELKRGEIFILESKTKLPERGIGGHQGDYANYPDDTLIALRAAVEKGAHFVEFDVQQCRSGEFFILHDHELEKKSNLKGYIWEKDYDYVRSGHIVWRERGNREFPDEKIATLEEVMDILPRDNFLINLHCYGPDGNHTAREVAKWVKAHGRLDQCYIACRLEEIADVRTAVPEIAVCNMTRPAGVDYYSPWPDEKNAEYLRTTIENHCQYLQLRQPWPRKFSDEAHAAGVKVNLCTCEVLCNDPANLKKMMYELGHDYILTENLGPVVREFDRLEGKRR